VSKCVTFLTLATMLLASGCSVRLPTLPWQQSQRGQWIAFESSRDGNPEIYKMRADGGHVTRLTNSDGWDRAPSWSPDGNWIAFESDRDGNWEIYRVSADGRQVARLTNNPTSEWSPSWRVAARFNDDPSSESSPSWSPDGSWIAYESCWEGNWEIYRVRADGTQAGRLTDNSASDRAPSWSPDGKWVAFESDRDGNWEVYKVRADGSQVTRVTDNSASDRAPSWSPDGNWIAFESDRGARSEIYKMSADGSQVTRLTNMSSRGEGPPELVGYSWSPDGNWIAFRWSHRWQVAKDVRLTMVMSQTDLYKVAADGSQLTHLTDETFLHVRLECLIGAHETTLSWSPDGNWIALVSRRYVCQEIYRVAADGSQVVRLTHNSLKLTDRIWYWLGDIAAVERDYAYARDQAPCWGP
jgi:Tol biopolymer transport system component